MQTIGYCTPPCSLPPANCQEAGLHNDAQYLFATQSRISGASVSLLLMCSQLAKITCLDFFVCRFWRLEIRCYNLLVFLTLSNIDGLQIDFRYENKRKPRLCS